MLRQTQTSGCLLCQHGTAKNPPTRWRRKGTGSPPPNRHREPTPEPTPPLRGTPHAPTGDTSRVQASQIVNVAARYKDSYTAFPCAELFDDEDTEHDTDFDPDMLTDEG